MTNPLLDLSGLPDFQKIGAEHAIDALNTALTQAREDIAHLQNIKQPNWENFAQVMEDSNERIDRVWSPISHLNAVKDSTAMRTAYETGIAMLTDYHNELGQNPKLYQQYRKLRQSNDFDTLSKGQKKVIENNLIDFRLAGAELDKKQQARFREIQQQLADLSNRFDRNLLDATQAWELVISEQDKLSGKLAGLPDSSLQLAQQLAQQNGKQGYLFNLQIPSYLAIMQYADDATLREKMYHAYSTRASEQFPCEQADSFDNTKIIEQILELRQQEADLLGYSNYAELSLVKKMARSVSHVTHFLDKLTHYAKPVAEKELEQLRSFAKQHDNTNVLQPWDISYYAEKLKQHRFDFNDEQVKAYFPIDTVFNGLFDIIERLFNIQLKENPNISTWDSQVRCFDLFDENQQPIGLLYADLYMRENKRGGAWMSDCIGRKTSNGITQNPVAFLTCNFTPPIGDNPALLTHNEVETLFHEMGHCLHHLLTKVDEISVSGINGVAWDAVELPSQFLENWCWHEDSLPLITKHYQTGEPLNANLLNRMREAKNFQNGLQTVRQIEFASFDILLHSNTQLTVQQQLDQVRKRVAVIEPPEYNRFQNSFSHIFAGGYAAGYYSYKWAEVLSADAFSRFLETGIFNQQTGLSFRQSILERGGAEDINDLFIEFRQREPDIEPLLEQTGIL